jgi:hypothetical protein
MKLLLMITALSLAAPCQTIAQDPPQESAPADSATPEEIDVWIDQLDADQFLDRETATENLVRAGVAAVQPLLDAMQGRQLLERDMRAVFVLKQIALSSDPAAEDAARTALARVAALRPGTASQNAIETLAALSTIREKRALVELAALGATSRPDPTDPFGEKYYLEIDDEWKGKDEDLQRLSLLVNMSQLTLAGSKVNGNWLSNLHEIPLVAISINRATITDDSLANLPNLPQLRLVELKYVPVGNASLVHLSKLKNTHVSMLRLYGTLITPDGAAGLQSELGQAIEVDHRLGAFLGISAGVHPLGCMITDVRPKTAASGAGLMLGDIIVTYGGSRVFDFEGLTKLISMNRPKDEVELQFVRNVEIRSGIRVKRENDKLGISGQDHALGSEVTDVERDSIAAYLGVRKGDIIYQVNDKPVGGAKQLEQVVEGLKVGEPVTLDFARRAEIRKIKIQLGEWE